MMVGLLIMSAAASAVAPARVSNQFEFELAMPLAEAAPYFGPLGERAWAGSTWDPLFIYPAEAKDVEGAVFTIERDHVSHLWINTVFDTKLGRMQYVAVSPGVETTTIDVALHPIAKGTHVQVTYTRTALAESANELVQRLGERDKRSGPEWQSEIMKAYASRSK